MCRNPRIHLFFKGYIISVIYCKLKFTSAESLIGIVKNPLTLLRQCLQCEKLSAHAGFNRNRVRLYFPFKGWEMLLRACCSRFCWREQKKKKQLMPSASEYLLLHGQYL
jgi:hypothetical protein